MEILKPSNLSTTVEKNILTAPGRPGSVDKGEREERGVRLAISAREKVDQLQVGMRLKIINGGK